MQKKHFIFLAFTVSLLYWILDAFSNVLRYNSALSDELFLLTPHSLVLVKILSTGLLFALSLTPLYFKAYITHKKPKESIDEFGELQRVSDILFSSLSTKLNVIKSLEILQEILHLKSSLLFIYNKESLTLYNENEFIKTAFRSKEILPFRTNPSRSPVEEVAIACFIEKRAFSQDDVKVDDHHVTLFNFMLKEDRSEFPLGNLMLASDDAHFIEQNIPMIQKYIKMLTYALSLAAKKELLQSINIQYSNDTISHFDKVLNIINFTKVQEYVEHEFKRHKRYHTQFTLVLIDITMLKTLVKIFPEEVIVAFKKDFIHVVKKHTREVDILGKWSNDQFTLLLPDVDFRAGQKVAQKLQTIFDEIKFARVGKVRCSYGITSLSPKDTMGSFKARVESALVAASIKEGNSIEVKLQNSEL